MEVLLKSRRVVQRRSGKVELKVVRGREWDEERFSQTMKRVAAYFKGLPVEAIFCDEIPASKSGKRRPIVVEN